MTVSIGDRLVDATLSRMTGDGPENVGLHDLLVGRNVVLFGLPGAFTPTCSSSHVPSFIRTAGQFFAKGIDEIICVSVNDIHVMRAWAEQTSGAAAGITFLADADSSFTRAIGMQFDAPAVGMFARSKRYSMLVRDGVVAMFNPEIERGACDMSAGEFLLAQID